MRSIAILVVLLPVAAHAATPDFSPMTQLVPTNLVAYTKPAQPAVKAQPAAVCVGGVCTIPQQQSVCGPQGCATPAYSQPVYSAPVRYYAPRQTVRYFRTSRPVRSFLFRGVCGPGGCR